MNKLPSNLELRKRAFNIAGGPADRLASVATLILESGARRVAEVGVFGGTLTKWLLSHEPGRQLVSYWAIDPWKPFPIYNQTPEWWEQQAVDMYKLAMSAPQLKILRLTSAQAASLFGKELELVFVDGDHSYEAVKEDNVLWVPKIVSGGVICGHDYYNPSVPGVTQAVDECFGNKVQFLEDSQFGHGPASTNSIWYVEV